MTRVFYPRLASILAALAVSTASGLFCESHAAPRGMQQQPPAVTVFENVNVVPMDEERVLLNHTVIVRHGRITAVGPSGRVTVPEGAVRIDGRGKYLMPGLAEMHGHTPVPGGDPRSQFVSDMMFLYAANGVTTVRGMLGGSGQLELRELTSTGQIIGPTLYLAGPSFSGNSITSSEQASQRVRNQRDEGWDLLKVHPGLTRDEYDAMALTAGQVGIRFGGHVPSDVGLVHAITMGQETFDHLDGYLQYTGGVTDRLDEAKLAEVVRLTRDVGAAVVPTMVLWEVGIIGLADVDELLTFPELRYWPQRQVESWGNRVRQGQANPNFNRELAGLHAQNRRRVLKALNDGGATILMGTDSPQIFSVPGFSLHREMQAMAAAGLTPYEILRSGTKNVGEYFQRHDSFGTVAIGRRADFILTNSNPLDDVANVADRAGVMVRGRWLSEEMIQERLAEIANRVASR